MVQCFGSFQIQAFSLPELDAHLRARLASYKLPRGYEIVDSLPSDEAGNIRRGKLRDERGG